jgi:DNA-binding NtrC family response regulator
VLAKAPAGTVYAASIPYGSADLECLLAPIQALARRVPGIAIVDPRILESEAIRRQVIEHFDAWLPIPLDVSELVSCARSLLRIKALRESVRLDRLRQSVGAGLQGESAAMQRLLHTIERISDSDAPVLILGETGTGKELVARAIHQGSGRAGGPLVAVNCGAIAPTLIQAELFGHERNAFTGASLRRAGSFEAADHGSVFLDEIGELPLATQPALLRVLQERSVTRLGSTAQIPVDFRLIAATHVDLPVAVSSGAFREDLYFRINVLTVEVPPLRVRDDDVLMLAESFRERFVADSREPGPRGFSRDALESLRRHVWPGNVRELLNRVQRAVVMAEGRLIRPADLGLDVVVSSGEQAPLADARSRLERAMVTDSLRRNGHSVAGAARQLGISRVTMYRMMARLKIDSPERADLNGSTDLAPSAPPAVVSGAKQRRCIG